MQASEQLPTAVPTPQDPQSFFQFTSVALTDDFNLTLTGSRMGNDASDEFTLTRYCKPHPDMLKALRRLTLHMCLLTEQLTDQQLYPGLYGLPTDALNARLQLRTALETGEAFVHPLLERFRCTSVLWKPKGVVLKGVKQSRYRCFGNSLKVETPVVDVRLSLDEDEEPNDWEYPFFEQMANSLAELSAELVHFMNGKYGEGGEQLQLFGRDPEPRSIGEITSELMGALDSERYSVEVGVPGGQMRKVGGEKAKRTFDGKELDSE